MDAGWSSYPAQAAVNGVDDDVPMPVSGGSSAMPPIPPEPSAKRLRLKLDDGTAVRKEIVRIYRQIKAGEIDIVKGAKLVWTLDVLSRHLERENVEKLAERLDRVEQAKAGR